MRRLIISEDLLVDENTEFEATQQSEELKQLLAKIQSSFNNITDDYYILLDNLQVLFNNYPQAYTNLEQVLKLPDANDIQDIVDLKNNFEDIKDTL